LAKIGRCEVAEKSSRIAYKKDTRPGYFLAPYFAPTLPMAPKISRTLSALDLRMCTDFGLDRMRFAGLNPERVKKVNTI